MFFKRAHIQLCAVVWGQIPSRPELLLLFFFDFSLRTFLSLLYLSFPISSNLFVFIFLSTRRRPVGRYRSCYILRIYEYFQAEVVAEKTAIYTEEAKKYTDEARRVAERQIEIAMQHWRTR